MGPNIVSFPRKPPPQPVPVQPTAQRAAPIQSTLVPLTQAPHPTPTSTPTIEEDPLWAYEALNNTNPNMTKSCWLCYGVNPPFYEGVALNASHLINATSPDSCRWHPSKTRLSRDQELALKGSTQPPGSVLPSYMSLVGQMCICFLPIIVGGPAIQD